jgi:four helix bundle protein
MWSDKQKAIMQAKIDVRHFTRELIRDVFQATEHFPQNDPDQISSYLRKKTLSVSSLTSHGTTRTDFEEQNQELMLVMAELKEVLKLITIAAHLKFCSQQTKIAIRKSITNVINALDDLVLLQQREE